MIIAPVSGIDVRIRWAIVAKETNYYNKYTVTKYTFTVHFDFIKNED